MRTERGARFVVRRDPENGNRWVWARWSNGRVIASDSSGVVDLRQALRNIEAVSNQTFRPMKRGSRGRLLEGALFGMVQPVQVLVEWGA